MDMATASTAAQAVPGWVGWVILGVACVIFFFVGAFSQRIPRFGGMPAWQRIVISAVVGGIAGAILWFVAYHFFNIDVP